MTPQELQISIISYYIYGLYKSVNEQIKYKSLWEVTVWDKRFKGVERYKQPLIKSYKSILAGDFPELVDPNGDILLLSTGQFTGFTSSDKINNEYSIGEIISIPGGGSPNIKYWNGKFVTADNRICTSSDNSLCRTKFIYYFLLSKTYELKNLYRGTSIKHPDMKEVLELKIPFISLEDQEFIISKIEKILPLIEQFKVKMNELNYLNDLFPDELKKSILRMAIEGKLVEQRPKEGTAIDLYNSILTKRGGEGRFYKTNEFDFYPFDIPDSWIWVKLSDIGELSRGKSKHRPRNDQKLFKDGVHPFIQTGDVAQADIIINSCKSFYSDFGLEQSRKWPKGTVCLTIAANIGDVAMLGFDACFPDSVVGFNSYYSEITNYFVMYGLMSYKSILDELSHSTAQKNINLDILSKIPFPLPPLEEQKRIVEKIEELLPLCRKLI